MINDMRAVDFRVDISEIMGVRDVPFDRIEPGIRRRVAFVAGSTFGHAMLRVLADLRQHDNQSTGVFDEFREAFRWIERPALGRALPPHIDTMLDEVQSAEERESDGFIVVMKRA